MPGVIPEPNAAERVLLGAHLLSAKLPGWWREDRIDPLCINMAIAEATGILPLLFGRSYHMGLATLDLRPEDAVSYGFAARDDRDAVAERDAWLLWITRRRAEAQSPQHARKGIRP